MLNPLKIFLISAFLSITVVLMAQQVADNNFRYKVITPLYAEGEGSTILYDEYHNNEQTLKGTYRAFNKLLSADGYLLQHVRRELTADILNRAKIYVTVNAQHNAAHWDLPVESAFTAQEIDAIYEWVSSGGNLFLITDHMPCSGSSQKLAAKFGFNLINGFAIRKDGKPEIFSRRKHNLLGNSITNAPGAEIDSIMIWGGSGFIAPTKAEIISVLGEDYNLFLPSKISDISYPISDTIPKISGLCLTNGACLKLGKGRVVVFADGAAFTAQLEGVKSNKRGMNHPNAAQNAEFLLNIIHWLDGKLQ